MTAACHVMKNKFCTKDSFVIHQASGAISRNKVYRTEAKKGRHALPSFCVDLTVRFYHAHVREKFESGFLGCLTAHVKHAKISCRIHKFVDKACHANTSDRYRHKARLIL